MKDISIIRNIIKIYINASIDARNNDDTDMKVISNIGIIIEIFPNNITILFIYIISILTNMNISYSSNNNTHNLGNSNNNNSKNSGNIIINIRLPSNPH